MRWNAFNKTPENSFQNPKFSLYEMTKIAGSHAVGLVKSFVVSSTMAKSNILIFHRWETKQGPRRKEDTSLSFSPTKAARTQHTCPYCVRLAGERASEREKNAYFQFIIRAERNANRRPSGKSISGAFHFFFAMSRATKMVLITAQSTQLDYSTRWYLLPGEQTRRFSQRRAL
jgi:hypothetical protein